MAPFVVRRSERIDYRVPVTLFATRDNVPPVIGRSLDVSEGGMRVLAPIPMPVGAVVRCELALDGRSALLEGRVAWLSQASMPLEGEEPETSQALGIGIRFETMSREESGVLRKLISQATEGYMPAELELHGVRAPVAARAIPTESGARISAALPWLRRGAPVGVRFIGAPADVQGHIADAVLRELPSGGRRLQIEVEAEAPLRARRDTQYGDALEFERARPLDSGEPIDVEGVEKHVETSGSERAQQTDDNTSFEAPARRTPTWLVFCLGAALGVAGTAAWMRRFQESAPPIVRLTQSEAHAALEAGSLAAAAVAGPAAAPEIDRDPTAQAPAPKPTEAPEAPSLAPANEPVLAASNASAELASAPASATEPVITSGNGVATVRFPFQGDLEGMTSRIWAEPYALAIDLPNGSTSVALGRHPVNDPEGIVSVVRLQAKGRALLVRVALRKPISSHSVALGGDLLELRVVAAEPATSAR